jgi:L-aspartate oxidase
MEQPQTIRTDFLVIGSGVAGLRAAIELSRHGKVLVVTKDVPTESATEYAQGGVAVALSDEDEVGIHVDDTIRAGDGLCRQEAVKVLVEEGPERILELISWGAEFDREGSKLSFTMEAAHSRRRILHAHGDSTGKEIERVLITKVRGLDGVQRLPFCTALDLIVRDGVCGGALVMKASGILAIHARATVLATGGAGQVYSRTTNPLVTTGDGMAMAYRAGVDLEDMEFVQFHPTALFAPSAPQFLLSEALRGEGAILRDINRETFMAQYHQDAELAPRDVVSRAIVSRMVRTSSAHVYLDLTHLDPEFIRRRFPKIYSTCLQYDLNIVKDLIPVSPAAHYVMGGVKTDLTGATSIRGLYAAGEVACTGVHGANRLASNSLLEGLVYGYRAGAAAAKAGAEITGLPVSAPEIRGAIIRDEQPHVEEMRTALRRLMWERAGIIRCGISLQEAAVTLTGWSAVEEQVFLYRRGIELKNMLNIAMLITTAAFRRESSVGAHYRSDFPDKCADWRRHITIRKAQGGPAIRLSD